MYYNINDMRIGYRIIEPQEAGRWRGELVQISVYKNWGGSFDVARDCAERCREVELAHVLHPVGFSLLDEGDVETVLGLLDLAGEAIILHDERTAEGTRLSNDTLEKYLDAVREMTRSVHVSLENSEFTADAVWFWRTMGGGVTLDMGHMERSGIDSAGFVAMLPEDIISRVDYVHMHHNNGLHGGITDHWPLRQGCRELMALEVLLERRKDIGVILEINERDETEESLRLLAELKDRVLG
jgi:sugar phosphate isomerase/epimerase